MRSPALAAAWQRLRRHLAGRGEWWWAPFLYVVAVMWIHHDLWHQRGQATGLGWDVVDAYGPDLDFQARDLRDGALSSWNPYDRGGYPVIADPQFLRYYPVQWPFVALGAITGSRWWLIQLEMLAHQVLAASILHLYLRSRGLSRSAAVIGGIALVAGVPLIVYDASLVFLPVVWVPLAWLAIDKLVEAPSIRRGLGVAGACTLIVTAGSPPGWLYAAILVGAYAAHRVVGAAIANRAALAAYTRRLIGPAVIATIGVALVAAVIIVPFREMLPLTSRPWGRAFALSGPLEPAANLAGMVAPTRGALHSFVGLTVLTLALAGAAVAARRDGRIAVTWLALAVFAIAASFGDRWPVLPFLVDHVPGFELFRVPPRYRLVMMWTLAPLAALGWSAVCDRALARRHWRRAVAIGIAVVATCVVLVVALDAPPNHRSSIFAIAAAAAAAAVVIGLRWLPPRALPAVSVVIAILVAEEPRFFLYPDGLAPPAEMRRPIRPDEDAILAGLGDVAVGWRVWDEFVLCDRVGARRRVRDFRGYPAGDPLNFARYNDVINRARDAPRLLEAYNVRWILHGDHPREGTNMTKVKAPTRDGHYVADGANRFRARHAAPLVAWYGAITVPTTNVLDAVLGIEDRDGNRRIAVIEPSDAAQLGPDRVSLEAAAAAPPDAAIGAVTAYATDAITARVDAPAAGVVVLNEIMYPGWEVSVDGLPATPLRANYLLRAVEVGAGSHTVTWRFRPHHYRVVVAGYLLALAAIVATWPPWRRFRARLRRKT
jgi:hypothetical protein